MNTQALPLDFCEEAQTAYARHDRAHLILLTLEITGLPWADHGSAFLQDLLEEMPPSEEAERVILFTGHRVDSPNRTNPRFPPEAEPMARKAIFDVVSAEKQKGHLTGLAGGANGGDILFLETCTQLEIPFHLLLALPQAEFIQASVATPSGDWVARFHTLAEHSGPRILSAAQVLPDWLSERSNYSFWARNNLWLISSALALSPKHFTLLALWDGGTGDGPGGTENMVQTAQKNGAELVWLDTRQIVTQTTRTATP